MTTETESPKAKLARLRTELKDIDSKIEEIEAKDWKAFAQETVEKFYGEFDATHHYLENCADHILTDMHIMSPVGRRRNMWRVLTGRPGILAAAQRRGKNAPIQGFASELGCAAGTLIIEELYLFLRRTRKWNWQFLNDVGLSVIGYLLSLYNRAVHDANYYTVRYETMIPHIHIMQHQATYGVARWYEENFDIKFNVDPEIELDFSATADKTHTWNWALHGTDGIKTSGDSLDTCLFNSLVDQVKLKQITSSKELKRIVKVICAPWEDQEMRDYLNQKYPLLGVTDLDTQIEGFLESFNAKIQAFCSEPKNFE
jgi:hypothetical protein